MREAPLLKAGLLVLAPDGASVRQTIVFQFNPETLTRQIGPAPGAAPAEADAVVETIRLEAHFDALAATATEAPVGIAPVLAALEALVMRGSDAHLPPPLVLLAWGRQRLQPVRVLALDINEQAFDRALNPLRAQVTLHLRARMAHEFVAGSRGATLLAVHARTRAALAAQVGPQGLEALGLAALP
ncbi:MAG: hypothetical protein DI563_03580 [Variovorax paradoxus]|uniref:Contractile injection system tube protein N-terminal domain-containing protein n=1 Tax=Variovorax paradoxus TaxID=34073 RepID=A0A2W5SCZ1_VARPD|nr:MAG: hypothetical protein DI563_03580 [Variovorax paradoxus]